MRRKPNRRADTDRRLSSLHIAAIAIMSLVTSAQLPAAAQAVAGTPQEATASAPRAVNLNSVPMTGNTAGSVIKKIPRPQNGISDSEYRALKARLGRHPEITPAGDGLPAPVGGRDGSSTPR
jgi:hypothetical protein